LEIFQDVVLLEVTYRSFLKIDKFRQRQFVMSKVKILGFLRKGVNNKTIVSAMPFKGNNVTRFSTSGFFFKDQFTPSP
jgi:hypothetical protein